MKKYLKEIVFTIHAVLLIVCLIPFYYHSKVFIGLSVALVLINAIATVCSIIYFFENDFLRNVMILIALFIFIFFPVSVNEFNEKKDIDECPVYANVVLDSVTIFEGRKGNSSYNLYASYFVKDKKYYFYQSILKIQSYLDNPNDWLYKKGDTVSIAYSCTYPEINRRLYFSERDSSWYYEESQ